MLTTTLLAALVGVSIQDENIGKGATITMLPGVQVQRNRRTLPTDGKSIRLTDGDRVSIHSPASERYSMIAPDNSVVYFHSGSSFRVEKRSANREEYVLTRGKFDIWSCPHGAPEGAREVSFRTCCIRIWYGDQKEDVRVSVRVVGHERCEIKTTSGIVWKQKTEGPTAVGPILKPAMFPGLGATP